MRQPIVRWNRSTRPNPIDVTRPMIGRLNVPSDKFCEYFTSETGRDCSRSTYGMLIAAHGCMTVLQLTSWRWTQSGDEQNVAAVVVMIARVIYWLYRVVFGRYLRTVAITTAPAAAALSGLTASANATTCLHRRSTQWSAHYKFTKRRKSRRFNQTKTFPRKCTGTVHTVYYCDICQLIPYAVPTNGSYRVPCRTQGSVSVVRRPDSPIAYRLSSLPVNVFNKTVTIAVYNMSIESLLRITQWIN